MKKPSNKVKAKKVGERSKKKERSSESPLKQDHSKWQDFLHRHSKAKETVEPKGDHHGQENNSKRNKTHSQKDLPPKSS